MQIITLWLWYFDSTHNIVRVYFLRLNRPISYANSHLCIWVLDCSVFSLVPIIIPAWLHNWSSRLIVVPDTCQVGWALVVTRRIWPIGITICGMRNMAFWCCNFLIVSASTLSRLLFWTRFYNIVIWILVSCKLCIALFRFELWVFHFGMVYMGHALRLL